MASMDARFRREVERKVAKLRVRMLQLMRDQPSTTAALRNRAETSAWRAFSLQNGLDFRCKASIR
jgi:phosphoribosylanthranilate isomerase